MIDDTFNVWLIEVNSNPCLELSCPLLATIIPNLIENVLEYLYIDEDWRWMHVIRLLSGTVLRYRDIWGGHNSLIDSSWFLMRGLSSSYLLRIVYLITICFRRKRMNFRIMVNNGKIMLELFSACFEDILMVWFNQYWFYCCWYWSYRGMDW